MNWVLLEIAARSFVWRGARVGPSGGDAPLVCAFKRCHNQCTETRDCPKGERCIQSDRPYRAWQLGDEQACGLRDPLSPST